MEVAVAVSPQATEGRQLKDDPREEGEVIALQVEFLEAGTEGEGVWEAAEVVSVEGEGLKLAEAPDGGREVAESGVVEVQVCQVRYCPELGRRWREVYAQLLIVHTNHPHTPPLPPPDTVIYTLLSLGTMINASYHNILHNRAPLAKHVDTTHSYILWCGVATPQH